MKAPKTICLQIYNENGNERKDRGKVRQRQLYSVIMITVFIDLQGYVMVNVKDLPTIHIHRNQS